MKILKPRLAALAFLLAACAPATAVIIGPYTPDAQTLHLWHLDNPAAPALDAATSGGLNLTALGGGATLGNPSFPGFGTALNTIDAGQADTTGAGRDAYLSALPLVNSTADNVSVTWADPVTGAFTLEAIVLIQFDPAVNFGTAANGGNGRNATFQIVTGEDEANAGRIFQFRLAGIGTYGANSPSQPALEFINVRQAAAGQVQNAWVLIPIDGPDAIVSNNWYHVAVTYDGNQNTQDNLKFYWTLLDSSRTAANLIATATLVNDPSVATTDFAIGNIGRNPSQNAFLGLIDEVRISKVARPADQMQLQSDTVVISTQPASQTVGLGQSASFTVGVSGPPPFFYQWRLNSSPITDATNATLVIPSAQLADAGDYDVIITNGTSEVVSDIAALMVHPPVNLAWEGSFSADWDSLSDNWINLNLGAMTTFGPGDHVTINDEIGSYSPNINLIEQVRTSGILVDTELVFTLTGPGAILAADSLTKRGSGSFTLGVNTDFTGPTIIEAGTLNVGDGATRGALGSGPVTNNGVLVFNRSDSITVNGPVTGEGSVIKDGAGSVTIRGINNWAGETLITAGTLQIGDGTAAGFGPGAITVNGALTFNASNDLVIDTIITGSGAINQNGSGMLTLSAPNDYHGISAVNGGTLLLAHETGLGDVAAQTTIAGGYAVSRVALPGDITTAEPFRLGGRQPAPNASALAAHLINLAGANTLTGDITSEAGGNQYNIESAAGLLVMAGNYSQFAGTGDRFLNLQGEGDALWTGAINNGTANTIVNKRGGGTWTLAGTSTYSGITTVSNGTLLVDGQIGMGTNAVLAYAGTTLGGSGNILGPVFIGAGATLAPGASSPGTLSINGALTLAPEAVTVMEIDRATGAFDAVAGLTEVTFGGTLKVTLVSGALAEFDQFQLFNAGTYQGSFAALNLPAPGAGLAWDTSTLEIDGTLRVTKAAATTTPGFASVAASGGNLVFSGTNGVPGGKFVVLSSTNVAAPFNTWLPVLTNLFDAAGACAVTNAVSPAEPQRFFILRQP